MSVSYHRTVDVLQGYPVATPFDRAEWYALLAEAGAVPLVVQAPGCDGGAALALTRTNGRLEPLRNWYSFAWRAHGHDPQALRAIAASLRNVSPRVVLWPLPDEDGTATRLEQAFAAAGWQVGREECDRNHVLPVAGRSFAGYWADRPGELRSTVRRKAGGVEAAVSTGFAEEEWDAYEAVYRSSWKPGEGDPRLLRRFARHEGLAGRLRLGLARAAGKVVAAQFWTVERGTAYIHKLAHCEEAGRLSAGTVLSAAMFAHAIDRDRVDWIDFGTGDDRYKRDWMELVRPRYRLDCLDPRQPRAWPALARRALRRLA